MPLPLYPDLPISRAPWITIGVIAICLLLHLVKTTNDTHNYELAVALAQMSTQTLLEKQGLSPDEISGTSVEEDLSAFTDLLVMLSNDPYAEGDWQRFFGDFLDSLSLLDTKDLEPFETADEALVFYRAYEAALFDAAEEIYYEGRWSVDRSFIEHTHHFNPLRWVTSTLIHADWGHLIFNLVFFFAFAVIVEILIDNWRTYIGLLVSMALVIGLADWAVNLFTPGYYSLGLSGVVMGVIGISAYLYPKGRIRIFEIFTWFYGRTLSVPVWALALFFIGGDTLTLMRNEDTSGINVFAHVIGGFAGFLLAAYFLRERKEEIQDELDEAVELRRAHRADNLGILNSAITTSPRTTGQEIQRRNEKALQNALDRIYRDVNLKLYADATVRLVDLFEDQGKDISRALEIFKRIQAWTPSIISLHAARLLIYRLVIHKRLGEALDVLRWATRISHDFVLGDPHQAPVLLNAMDTIPHNEALIEWFRKGDDRFITAPQEP